ncbi:hypothetical protein T12_3925 [Trichinella patagoniensis]|uniref:Uncharacterized protein n=1 Tax=Trichinella patagoniensis TaxID=990121 RepID=A0A0V0ZUJ0_9BILA|nr:hypothetical protein T12_3925 [Trichinella patagoniensis]
MNNAWNLQRIRENCHRTRRVYEPIYMSTYDIPVAVAIQASGHVPPFLSSRPLSCLQGVGLS